MNWLIAPNAYKGTISAARAAQIIAQGIPPKQKSRISPIADGGDGTCYLLAKSLGLKEISFTVLNAIGQVKAASIFLTKSQKDVFLDVSAASGLDGLASFQVNASLTSTFGTGLLIAKAAKMDVAHVVLGLGGSATVDMGTGILSALGYLFLDKNGREIPVFSPGYLGKIAHIQRPLAKFELSFTCLCDVDNLFFGTQGAVPVFGKQKGLKGEELRRHEEDAERFFDLLIKKSPDLKDAPGFGAAGGIAMGLSAFFPVEIKRGARYFFEQVEMEEKVGWADWVITGEGRFDLQSRGGKGSYELLKLAKKHQKKVLLITSGNRNEAMQAGFDKVLLLPELDMEERGFKEKAERNLKYSVEEFFDHFDQ